MPSRNIANTRHGGHCQASTRGKGNELQISNLQHLFQPQTVPTTGPRTHPIPPPQEANRDSLSPDRLANQLQLIQISNPQPQPQTVPTPSFEPRQTVKPMKNGNGKRKTKKTTCRKFVQHFIKWSRGKGRLDWPPEKDEEMITNFANELHEENPDEERDLD